MKYIMKYILYGFEGIAPGHDGAFPVTSCHECGSQFVVTGETDRVINLHCPEKGHNFGSVGRTRDAWGNAQAREYNFVAIPST